jgi:hypothetical protein
MRWQDKPIRHPGPSSPTEKICDMCGRPLRRKKNLLDRFGA